MLKVVLRKIDLTKYISKSVKPADRDCLKLKMPKNEAIPALPSGSSRKRLMNHVVTLNEKDRRPFYFETMVMSILTICEPHGPPEEASINEYREHTVSNLSP